VLPLSQMMNSSVPLVQPMDLSRWNQPISNQVQISHDRYHEHDHDESSPAPFSETPELEHIHGTPIPLYREFGTASQLYDTSVHDTPSWPAHVPPAFVPLGYKSDYPAEVHRPRLPTAYSYSYPQPSSWESVEAQQEERFVGRVRRSDKERRHVW